MAIPAPAPRPAPPPVDASVDALFLDVDGTLAEIAPSPDQAALAPAMLDALAGARDRLGGRVALVSGRSLAQLQTMVPVPGVALAGVHGLERILPDGRVDRPEPSPAFEAARRRIHRFAEREQGLLVEDKGLGIALHYRGKPGLAPLAHARANGLARRLGLTVQTGKMVVELRLPGADKGAALAAFMAEPPFAGFRPLFAGDDDTDESAFAAATGLGGYGVRVGGPPGIPTAAAYALADVAAVEAWLGALA